jgi:hypothetical protein
MKTQRALSWAGLGVLLGVACSFPVNPNTARFACGISEECGTGFSCHPQTGKDAGVCFPESDCGAETCNGLDDDCDGQVDASPTGPVCP